MNRKFKLCWWEDNGYHDSYFYGVYFDEATGTVKHESLGATAYGGGIGFDTTYEHPTPEIVELARRELAKVIFKVLRGAENRDVLTPGPHNVERGRAFRLLEPHSFYQKRNGQFVKSESGKRVKITIPVGSVLVARKEGADFFGTSYKNGYNQPNRENTTLSVTYDLHQNLTYFVSVPMKKLRQNVEPMTDAELTSRAEELSRNLEFGAGYGCRAWETESWAKKVGLPVKG